MTSQHITDLATLAEESLQLTGIHPALMFDDLSFTNAEVLAMGRQFQSAFTDLGMTREDIAVVCMVNDPLVHSVFLGGFRTGATIAPVISQLTARELEFIIQHTHAHAVITDIEKIDVMREAVSNAPHVEWIAVRGGTTNSALSPREYRLEDLLEYPEASKRPILNRDDMALLLYTSGTTGKPKGVMLTHGNLLASGETLVDAAELHLREHPLRSITALPMAHIFGISLMTVELLIPPQYAPGVLVQEPRFDAERMMRLIEQHQCTDLSVVPTMLSLMLKHPNFSHCDLSSLFKVDVGGSPMPVELARQWKSRVGSHVRQRYGMTENSGKGSTDRTSEPYHEGSVGRAYHTTSIRIVDDLGQPVGAGEEGEILTSGPTTMKGYFKDPEATVATIRDGWLHTGDIGYLSDDGWLYVVDRKKDLIIKGGENIYPAELENILYKLPDIADATVVGVPHEVYGEEPMAFVVPMAGTNPTVDAIKSHLAEHITKFKIPSRVVFLDSLPKNGVGKVLRRALRDEYIESLPTQS